LKVVSTSMPLPTNGYHWIIKWPKCPFQGHGFS
jgi:hypothetical protein